VITSKWFPNRILPPLPSHLTKTQLKAAKKCSNNNTSSHVTKLFAQVTANTANILKIKEAFPALPNKKIIEIHNASLVKPHQPKKIQSTTKGPLRKQAIIPLSKYISEVIMKDAGNHISLINNHLKHIKSTMCTEFICLLMGCISIITNNVPSSSDLTMIEQYIKSIEGINTNEVSPSCLP